MLNKKNKVKLIVASLVVAISLASYAVAALASSAAGTAGSADNPLVTLDYITNTLKPQIEADILAKVSGAGNNNSNNTPPVSTPPTTVAASANASYIVLELTRGQKVYAKSDSLELITRPGTVAAAISPHETQGLADLTSGEEILNKAVLPINHSLLIPRADGRGIEITSAIAYIMVRGEYEIK